MKWNVAPWPRVKPVSVRLSLHFCFYHFITVIFFFFLLRCRLTRHGRLSDRLLFNLCKMLLLFIYIYFLSNILESAAVERPCLRSEELRDIISCRRLADVA